MTTNDLSNTEKMLMVYFKELAKQEFPDVDLSDHGAFMETFGTPHVKMLLPLLSFADSIKLKQSLDNAHLMTEEEMDEVAGSYFTFRENGEFSSGYITFVFDDIPSNRTIQIPAGLEVASKQEFRYRNRETVIYNEEQLSGFYDPETFRYRIPLLFEAENPGEKYNIEENEIDRSLTRLPHLVEIYNEIPFRGGVDKETNVQLADRIKETAGAPNLGVEKGWKRFARNFKEVKDVLVAGMGHPLMKRDIIGKFPEGTFVEEASPYMHWGGKLDLHIRGNLLEEFAETKVLTMDENDDLIVPLSKHPTYDVREMSFTSSRYSSEDPTLDDNFFVVRDYVLMKDEDDETIGTLNEKSWVVIKDDRLLAGDTITVRYRYNALFEKMNEALYFEDNRPPTSDVLLKESRRRFVHGSMIVKMKSVVGLREKEKATLKQRLYTWIQSKENGEELQFSDMVSPLYEGSGATVDYIHLPPQFMVTDYDNRYIYYCFNQKKIDFLTELQNRSAYFSEYIPYYKDNITIYDFFDVMHLLTFENIAENVWEELSFKNDNWGHVIDYMKKAREMIAYANVSQRLSPSKWEINENEFFDLGNVAIFEDVQYATTNVETLTELFLSIANPSTTTNDNEKILHLTIFCCMMLYVITTKGELDVDKSLQWLEKITVNTPVHNQIFQ